MQLKAEGYRFEREVYFAKPRRWRFDFVVHGDRGAVAVEVEGGRVESWEDAAPIGLWLHGRLRKVRGGDVPGVVGSARDDGDGDERRGHGLRA